MDLPPELKLALYECYKKEHSKNPHVTIQDIYNMLVELQPGRSKKQNTSEAIPTPNQSDIGKEEANCIVADTSPKSCDIMLGLIANHRKLKKPIKKL
jgi:hypothetical protein